MTLIPAGDVGTAAHRARPSQKLLHTPSSLGLILSLIELLTTAHYHLDDHLRLATSFTSSQPSARATIYLLPSAK
ncbi:hypothetical protein KC362_g55 [Hortaea werneckii]|nr:hypothetical protein KC362_g55 [Hortaea werneckii]